VIYEAQEHVVASGHRSHLIDLERLRIRCKCNLIISYIVISPLDIGAQNRFKLLLDPNGASNLIPIIFPVRVTHFDINAARDADNVSSLR
jgi:hypothetical protein